MQMKRKPGNISPFVVVLFVAVAFLAMRFFFPLFMFMLIAGGVGLMYWLISEAVQVRQQRAEDRTPEGKLKRKISDIKEKRDHLAEELQSVQTDIQNLRTSISAERNVSETTRKESKELLRGFRQQRDLRMAKLNFYRTSLERLQSLLANYQLKEEIRKGRKRLRELESGQEESIADLEALSWDIRQDQLYLDTVEELEARLHLSDSPQSARRIQEELEAMTREMDARSRPEQDS